MGKDDVLAWLKKQGTRRTLDAMAPEVRDAYLRARHQIESAGAANPDYPLKLSMHLPVL